MTPVFTPRTLRYAVGVPYSNRRLVIAAKTQSAYARMELLELPGSIGAAAPALQSSGDLAGKGGVTVEFPTAERIVLAVAVTAQDGKTVAVRSGRAARAARQQRGPRRTDGVGGRAEPDLLAAHHLLRGEPAVEHRQREADGEHRERRGHGGRRRCDGQAGGQPDLHGVGRRGSHGDDQPVVSAEDGTQKMYRVRVSREAAAPGTEARRETRLATPAARRGAGEPDLRSRRLEYEAKLPSNVTSVTLTALAESPRPRSRSTGSRWRRTGRVITLSRAPRRRSSST